MVFLNKIIELTERTKLHDDINIAGTVFGASGKNHIFAKIVTDGKVNAIYGIMNVLEPLRNVAKVTQGTDNFVFVIVRQLRVKG